MASLDVLDYVSGLDEALQRRGMPAAYRRQAAREARRVIEAMAFRFAILDERPMPEDLDYLRAIEAMKPPERAVPVLERRVPAYRRARGRRLITTGIVLLILGSIGGSLAWLATSEVAEDLASLSHAVSTGQSDEVERAFRVTEEMDRLRVAGTVFVSGGNTGSIEVFLIGPDNRTHLFEGYSDRGTYYIRENVLDPAAGEWRLLVSFNAARGSAQVDVSGISPAR